MIDYKDEILNHIIKERDYYKTATLHLRIMRDKMIKELPTKDWQDITEEFQNALFMTMFDFLMDKLPDVPVEDLYCELEVMELDKIFELDN
jgi:hypothetical protein